MIDSSEWMTRGKAGRPRLGGPPRPPRGASEANPTGESAGPTAPGPCPRKGPRNPRPGPLTENGFSLQADVRGGFVTFRTTHPPVMNPGGGSHAGRVTE